MFDLYEELLKNHSLGEVLVFAASRAQSEAVEQACPISSAATEPVPYSPFEYGTKSIPISVDYARSA